MFKRSRSARLLAFVLTCVAGASIPGLMFGVDARFLALIPIAAIATFAFAALSLSLLNADEDEPSAAAE